MVAVVAPIASTLNWISLTRVAIVRSVFSRIATRTTEHHTSLDYNRSSQLAAFDN